MSHCFGSQAVLDSINLSLRKGELTALIGPNGAGNPLFCTFCKDCSSQAKAMLLLEVHPCVVPASHCTDATTGPHRLVVSDYRPRHGALRQPKTAESCFEVSRKKHWRALGFKTAPKHASGVFQEGNSNGSYSPEQSLKTPATMLLDEPCSALDPPSRERVIALLQSLAQEGRSICLTSHDWGPH